MKAKLAQQSGFPPQLMHSVHILRMGAEMLAEFLRQHNNLCLAPSHLPMRIDDDENIRRLLRRRCLDTPPPPALHDIVNDLIECIEDNGLLDIPPSWAADIAKQPLADAVTYLQSIAHWVSEDKRNKKFFCYNYKTIQTHLHGKRQKR